MIDDLRPTQTEPEAAAVKEPHLLDMGSVMEVAQWIAPFVLGFLADVAYDVTKEAVRDLINSIKRRFGKPRVREIEAKVAELIADVKSKSDLDDDKIAARVDEIFRDFR